MTLREWTAKITPPDAAAMEEARRRQAQLAKPPGSLGRLEDLSVQLAGITGRVHNKIEKKHLLVFAADNGVVDEGVSSAPRSVTLSQTINLTRGKTGAATLCKHFGCAITVCDVGVARGHPRKPRRCYARKVRLRHEAISPASSAMTREECDAAGGGSPASSLAAQAKRDGVARRRRRRDGHRQHDDVLRRARRADRTRRSRPLTGRGGGLTDEAPSPDEKAPSFSRPLRPAPPAGQERRSVDGARPRCGGLDLAAMCGRVPRLRAATAPPRS